MDKISELKYGKGYFQLKLKDSELESIRKIVNDHYLKNINKNYPSLEKLSKKGTISNYHKISKYIDHKKNWPMRSRTLAKKKSEKFIKLSFINELKKTFGNFKISDEYNIGHEEIYWLIVRPKKKSDVGSMHCDRWFWELNKDFTPKGKVRVKCWISLWCEGLNGLKVFPGSQLRKFKYSYENRDGEKKPLFKLPNLENKVKKLNCSPGTIIIFSDSLIHGGSVNNSSHTRVSIEFTMFVDKKKFN